MFEVFVYIVVTVAVLGFCGQSPDGKAIALEPIRYAASEMPSDVCLVIPNSEWLAPLRKAKRHDLGCMTAAEVRELCREHDIPVSGRGRISQAVLDQLAAVI